MFLLKSIKSLFFLEKSKECIHGIIITYESGSIRDIMIFHGNKNAVKSDEEQTITPQKETNQSAGRFLYIENLRYSVRVHLLILLSLKYQILLASHFLNYGSCYALNRQLRHFYILSRI